MKAQLVELKRLAETNVGVLLEIAQTQNRMGLLDSHKEKIYIATEDLLKNLGFTESEIAKIQKDWHTWVEHDYIIALLHSNNPAIDDDFKSKWGTVRNNIKKNIHSMRPKQLRDAFTSLNSLTQDIEEWISDFEYYQINRKHKNPEKWASRETIFRGK